MGGITSLHSPPRGLLLVLWYHTKKHYIEIRIPLIFNSTNVLICDQNRDLFFDTFLSLTIPYIPLIKGNK